MKQKLIRHEYGFLKDEIFLNVSLVVMPPRRVQDAYRNFMNDYVANLGDGVVARAWEIVAEARPKIAALINARNPGEIAFVKNTCEGLSILASGYPFQEGDEVVIADQEHQSNLYPWINQRRKGVILKIVKSVDGEIRVEDVVAEMTPRTRVLAVSSAQFSTGFRSDLRRLGEECRKRDIVFSVDGIQTLGRFVVDVQEMNIDWLAAGGNKGLLGTLGAGILYCGDRIVKDIIPPYAAYQGTEAAHGAAPTVTTDFEKLDWHSNAQRFESGNLNYNGILAISKGVDLLLELRIENIQTHIQKLEARLRKKIRGLPLRIVEPGNMENWSGIVCVYYPLKFEDDVKHILGKYKIHATMRGGYMRFGIGFYNTADQMDIVAKALSQIAELSEEQPQAPRKTKRSVKL